ncbi:MAG: AtpZ/AtpI family protein [Actinomycetota bacterium]|nr:AtpZ/AtpI family protein [Actinomycetota bacterium]
MTGGNFHREVGQALGEGWAATSAFLGSWLSGFLLGYLADRWLGTDPWLVVGGTVAGATIGFYRMYVYAKEQTRIGR